MIRTVTLNPGFDEVVAIKPETSGTDGDLVARTILPSGKGINAARTLRHLETPVTAYSLIGAGEAADFSALLDQEGIPHVLSHVAATTRRNLTIVPPAGLATHYRAPGFYVFDKTAVQDLLSHLLADLDAGDIVSLHGSLPSGLPPSTWSDIAAEVAAAGALVAVDIYGPALPLLLERATNYGGLLTCKINEIESHALPVINGDIAQALRYMSICRVALPAITLAERGIAAVYDEQLHHLLCPLKKYPHARMHVGAGDAAMAGLLSALSKGQSYAAAIRCSLSTAAAHVDGGPIETILARSCAYLSSITTSGLFTP